MDNVVKKLFEDVGHYEVNTVMFIFVSLISKNEMFTRSERNKL